jgi:hypothetical protein
MRRILHKLEKQGFVKDVGDVLVKENWEHLWCLHHIQDRQHQAEISEISLQVKADEIRRLYETDQTYRADAEIVLGENTIAWEHESSCNLNLRQIREKMARWHEWPGGIIWTCKIPSWIDKLSRYATHDRHLFTTYELACQDFHGEIWVDRNGKRFGLPVQ